MCLSDFSSPTAVGKPVSDSVTVRQATLQLQQLLQLQPVQLGLTVTFQASRPAGAFFFFSKEVYQAPVATARRHSGHRVALMMSQH